MAQRLRGGDIAREDVVVVLLTTGRTIRRCLERSVLMYPAKVEKKEHKCIHNLSTCTFKCEKEKDSPLWLLLIALTTIANWLRPKLDETIVELAMCPIELWIRGISKPKRGKPHLLQTSWSESCTADRPPELLAVWWQVALATSRNCNKHDIAMEELLLRDINMCILNISTSTYKGDGV